MWGKLYRVMFIGLVFSLAGAIDTAQADLLDLSSFSEQENQEASDEIQVDSVQVTGDTVVFIENPIDGALFFYNDAFDVPTAATISFDFTFDSDGEDYGDYFLFTLWYQDRLNDDDPLTVQSVADELLLVAQSSFGHAAFDLTAYGGQTVTIEWGLIWGGLQDNNGQGDFCPSGSTATISNIRLESNTVNTPVPEPTVTTLFSIGVLTLLGMRRKRS